MDNFEDFLLFPTTKTKNCRICGIESESGQLLFNSNNSIEKIAVEMCSIISIKLKNIQKYPNWICPGCQLQFETTNKFFEMIRNGQNKLVELFGDPAKPGRKPKAKVVQSYAVDDYDFSYESERTNEVEGKRITKPPERFKDTMQGNELENLYSEIGIVRRKNRKTKVKVIGQIEDQDSVTLGEMVSVSNNPQYTCTRYQCDFCQENFVKESTFFEHISTHKNVLYECTECQENFPTKALYDEHSIAWNHIGLGIIESPNMEVNELPEENSIKKFYLSKACTIDNPPKKRNLFKFTCIKCPKSFSTKDALKRHQSVHSEERAFKCDICSARFKLKAILRAHKVCHSTERPFKCARCPKSFRYKHSLATHLRIHDGLKPYLCSICNKSFTQLGNLREHKRIHTGERPYVCLICGTAFKTSSQCRLHQKTHNRDTNHRQPKPVLETEERTHECKTCGKLFSKRPNMIKHMRIHTGERPYSCHLCPKKFSDASNFKKHKSGHLKIRQEKRKAKINSLLKKNLAPITSNVPPDPVGLPSKNSFSTPDSSGLLPTKSVATNLALNLEDVNPNKKRSLMELLGEDDDTNSKACGLLRGSSDPIITEIHNDDNSLFQQQLLSNQLVCVSYQDPMNPVSSKTTFFVVN